jgi:PAS domain S-box-containing protein
VEIRFQTVGSTNLLISLTERPLVRLMLAVGAMGFVLYTFYMRRMLRHLDPSAVVPARVQHALDVMTEGVVLLDPSESIVLVNAAFAEGLGRTPNSLIGVKASSLDWKSTNPLEAQPRYPWLESIDTGGSSRGMQLRIDDAAGKPRVLAINAAPVLDGWGKPKGAIVTFDDVTLLESKSAALEAACIELEKSSPTRRMTSSPIAWPWSSFTRLKWSMSAIRQLNSWPAICVFSSSFSAHCMKERRLEIPVSGSRLARSSCSSA